MLRNSAGDVKPGEIGGVDGSPALRLVAAVIMLVPIAMLLAAVVPASSLSPALVPAGLDLARSLRSVR